MGNQCGVSKQWAPGPQHLCVATHLREPLGGQWRTSACPWPRRAELSSQEFWLSSVASSQGCEKRVTWYLGTMCMEPVSCRRPVCVMAWAALWDGCVSVVSPVLGSRPAVLLRRESRPGSTGIDRSGWQASGRTGAGKQFGWRPRPWQGAPRFPAAGSSSWSQGPQAPEEARGRPLEQDTAPSLCWKPWKGGDVLCAMEGP